MRAGSAVLLVGAGFSVNTPVGTGKVPSTADLTDELKDILEIPRNEKASLSDVAEYANEHSEGKRKLISHLINRLTSTQPNDAQRWIISQNWRAIFTTNFDDVIEQVSSKNRTVVTPATDSSSISPSLTPIFYLHGRALDARERDIDPKIVISESNYLELSQKNKDLYAKLFNEIACARSIILIGYSLRDLEVASGFLKSEQAIRNKTLIITSESDTEFTVSRLKKFGTVMPIGLNEFVNKLSAVPEDHVEAGIQFLNEELPHQAAPSNEADDFVALILRGELDASRYVRQQGMDNEPYCVVRSSLTEIEAAKVNRFIVSADFGNGKSIFLKQAATHLVQRGFRVFWVNTQLQEVFEEIEKVLRFGSNVAFIIDDVLRYRSVAIFIGERLNSQSLLIASTRGDQDFRFEEIGSKLGGAYRSIDLNILDDREIDAWDNILERWGVWESKAGMDRAKRISFIKNECASETRSVILSLFRESKISKTIDQIVNFFLRQNDNQKVAFAGLLISSLCQQHVTWQSIITWLGINEDELKRSVESSEIAFLFQRGRNWNLFTSSQLADFILRTRFVESDRDLLVDVYSTIVLRTAESANDRRSGWDYSENLKELMKFRFLTRLFGDNQSSTSLIAQVYRRLSAAPRIRENPQFWLQFAMSHMEVDDLGAAERYIATALSKAETRGADYSPFQILDQRARLYFIKNRRNPKSYSESEIRTALIDLQQLLDDSDGDVVYALRSLPLIEDFLEVHIDDLTADIRERIAKFLNTANTVSQKYDHFPRSQKGETRVLKDALNGARIILFNT